MKLEREEISTKFDETNQTIRVLRFENNFLAEKTKKLVAKLFQVRAQLERTSSFKLNEMLNLQKFAFDRTGLRYDFSSPSIASTSTTIFVPPTNNVETENNDVKNELASKNIDKGKFILGASPKLDKKEIKISMFLLNLNSFNSSLSPPDQGFAKWKDSSKVWKEKGL